MEKICSYFAMMAGVKITRKLSSISTEKKGVFQMSKRDSEVSGFSRTWSAMNCAWLASDVRLTHVLNSSWNHPLEISAGVKRNPCSTRVMNSRKKSPAPNR